MCGICGVVGIESREASEALTRRMMAAIVHRGPDEEGILIAPPVAAGIRRLSIIDLPGGSQPVWNETGTLAVVYNGEIYNFRELRKELEAAGHKFRTHSDTEMIVHAFESWGEKCVERLSGMFAFAIVELPEGSLGRPVRIFIARDRLGIKPLYYRFADGCLFFASEVRALLASGAVTANLSADAVTSYLLFGSVSEPGSMIEGVSSLPPGHYLDVRLRGEPIRAIAPKAYWSRTKDRAPEEAAETSGSTANSSSTTNSAARVRSLLEQAVASHLIADVPVGIFLSSGLDSTAIAALASRAQSGIHTFTLAFPDVEFSEADVARRTAERLGTNHSEFTLSGDEMLSRLDEAVAAFDQPSMDGINTYFVSWAARQAGLKVALSGLGSDELFGGYTSFRATSKVRRLAGAARWMPKSLRRMITPPSNAAAMPGASPDAFRKASAAWLDPAAFPHPYYFTRSLFTPQAVSRWLGEAPSAWMTTPWGQWLASAARETGSMDEFTAVSWLELRSYLVNTLLRDTDAMSMRHSLEVRVPFLDSALVEYVLSLPESAKRNPSKPKALLVEALGELLPRDLVAQPKRTFTFPWENWMRGALRERIAAGLRDWSPALERVLGGDEARKVWDDFLANRTTWSRPWSLYVLNEWVKRNLGGNLAGNSDRRKDAAVSVA
ncbi:MAG TPA: asparagine synthase (glutamine-hydrolyzing) [Candidatus Acidoferrales bacterium]|nr:asparagine synthase (glutamine-hydrolyzing) [Candidatus Acidoferrales bacterium]